MRFYYVVEYKMVTDVCAHPFAEMASLSLAGGKFRKDFYSYHCKKIKGIINDRKKTFANIFICFEFLNIKTKKVRFNAILL